MFRQRLRPMPVSTNRLIIWRPLCSSKDPRFPKPEDSRARLSPVIAQWRRDRGTLAGIEVKTIKRLILRRMKERRRLLPTGRRPLPKNPHPDTLRITVVEPERIRIGRISEVVSVKLVSKDTWPETGPPTQKYVVERRTVGDEVKPAEYVNVELDRQDGEAQSEAQSRTPAQLDIEGNEHTAMEWAACARCNRPLTNKASRLRGIGPSCAKIIAGQSAGESESELEAAKERRGGATEGVIPVGQLGLLDEREE